jgi:CRAL/TRIO domain
MLESNRKEKAGSYARLKAPTVLTLSCRHCLSLPDHYIYVNEYLWQIVESKNALATMTGIMDMQGLNLGMIRKADIMNFLKEFVKTMDSHYPQRAHKTLIVNAPKWFNLLYKIVSPILRESTKSRIEIHARGKRQDKALYSFLGKDAEKLLPASFFSKKRDKRDKSNRKNGDDDDDADENGDEDPQLSQEVPVMSQLESDLRSFVRIGIQCGLLALGSALTSF